MQESNYLLTTVHIENQAINCRSPLRAVHATRFICRYLRSRTFLSPRWPHTHSSARSHPHLSEPICGRSDCRSGAAALGCNRRLAGWLSLPLSICAMHPLAPHARLMKPCASLNVLIYLHAHIRARRKCTIHTYTAGVHTKWSE